MNKKLFEGVKCLSLNLDNTQFIQLEKYISCVLDFNKTYNLMRAANEDEMTVNHVLDSLAAVKTVDSLIKEISASQKSSSLLIADIGSGGGCPGIPLAIALKNQSFILVERMEKRATFLQDTILHLALSNTKIECSAADNLKDESFDIEVFRAFHPFDEKNTKLLLRLLKKGGSLVAFKAKEEKIRDELKAVKTLIPSYEKIKLSVPFLEDHERNLVIVKKQKNFALSFP